LIVERRCEMTIALAVAWSGPFSSVATANASTPLARRGTREIAELSAVVSRMAETLARRADYIRSFAAHVSHEFKTPLAGAKGAIELIEDHAATMSAPERAHFLEVAGASLDRLDRLVRRLVDLARADMMRPGGTEPTELAEVLRRVAERYRAYGLAVTAQSETILAPLPQDGLDVMLDTLLDNVVQHAGAGAEVNITATISSEDRVAITVADDGPGIPRDNRAHVFEPFFTTAREAGGTGLGLPIVHAIATAAGGTVSLVDSERGAVFAIDLPRAILKPSGHNAATRLLEAPGLRAGGSDRWRWHVGSPAEACYECSAVLPERVRKATRWVAGFWFETESSPGQ
jgi:signal transduction histidine kinase